MVDKRTANGTSGLIPFFRVLSDGPFFSVLLAPSDDRFLFCLLLRATGWSCFLPFVGCTFVMDSGALPFALLPCRLFLLPSLLCPFLSAALRLTGACADVRDASFDASFFGSYDVVLNGLDNLEARRHVNRLALAAGVPLVESGTAGLLGQVSVHVGGVTECFECTPKPVPKTYPICTIRNTPEKPIHCIVWAKTLLLGRVFGEEGAGVDLDVADGEDEERKEGKGLAVDEEPKAGGANAGTIESPSANDAANEAGATRDGDAAALLAGANAEGPANPWRPLPSETPRAFAKRVFTLAFTRDVARLAAIESMWENRAAPTPLDVEALLAEFRKQHKEGEGREMADVVMDEMRGDALEHVTQNEILAAAEAVERQDAPEGTAPANDEPVADADAPASPAPSAVTSSPPPSPLPAALNPPPSPLKHVPTPVSASRRLGLPDDSRPWTPAECAAVFVEAVADLAVRGHLLSADRVPFTPLAFDKDDALAVDLVAAAANLRAICYGIPVTPAFEVKGMAGAIVHAVATTNAIVSGLVTIEAIKIALGVAARKAGDAQESASRKEEHEDAGASTCGGNALEAGAATCNGKRDEAKPLSSAPCSSSTRALPGRPATPAPMYASRCTFIHQHRSGKRLLTPVTPAPPSASCRVCGGAEARIWCSLESFTLLDLVEGVLKKRFAMIHPTILAGGFYYEEGDDLDEDERAFNAAHLDKPLADLPGAGLTDGAVLEVADAAQNVTFKLRIRNKNDWSEEDEEKHPDKCIVEEGRVHKGEDVASNEEEKAAETGPCAATPAPNASGAVDSNSSEIEIIDDGDDDDDVVHLDEASAKPVAEPSLESSAVPSVNASDSAEAPPSVIHVAESSEDGGSLRASDLAPMDQKRAREEEEVQIATDAGEGAERAKRAKGESEVVADDDDVIVIDD